MRVIDLFSGCGGFSLGLKEAGFDIVAAYDNWNPAIQIYKDNFSHPIYNIDLGKIEEIELKRMKNLNPDVIVGGPPCQDYSSAGKRDESGGRANLTISFAEIISNVRPQYFIMENVHNLPKFKTLEKAKQIFKRANYGLTEIVLDASYYGVPQIRKRYFLVGELNGDNDVIKEYLHGCPTKMQMTMREYFGNKLNIDFYYRHPRSYNRRAVFSIDEPSPTIRGVNRPIPPTYKKHPGDKAEISNNVRALTTLERSYIQTFPEAFILNGSKTNLEQAIGNAVPVNLAKHVGNSLLEYIKDKQDNVIKGYEMQMKIQI